MSNEHEERRLREALTTAHIDATHAHERLMSAIHVNGDTLRHVRLVLIKEQARTLREEIGALLEEMKGEQPE